MNLEVSRSGVIQEYPLRATAAILDRIRKLPSDHPAKPQSAAVDRTIKTVIPNVLATLITSYMHPSVREEGARKLCESFQINGAEQNRVVASANNADSLQIQQAEVHRIINEYSSDPVQHPLPVNGRVYTAEISINLNGEQQVNAEVVRFLKNNCPNMQALSLHSKLLPDSTLEAVAECTSLKKLQIEGSSNNETSTKGLFSLRSLTLLESFSLSIPVDPFTITVQDAQQFLGAFKFLKELDFLKLTLDDEDDDDEDGYIEFTHTFFSALGSCPSLEELRFPVFPRCMTLLDSAQPALTRLRKVHLFFPSMSNEVVMSADDLKRFGNFKSLKSLHLVTPSTNRNLLLRSTIPCISVEILQAWNALNLQELTVDTLTQEGLEALGKFSELSHLAFSIQFIESKENRASFVENIRTLGALLTKVKTLKICDTKYPELAEVFSSFQNLEALEIASHCPITPTVARMLLAPLSVKDTASEDNGRWLDQVPVNLQKLTMTRGSFRKQVQQVVDHLVEYKTVHNKQVVEDLIRLKSLHHLGIVEIMEGDSKVLHIDDLLSAIAPHLSELRGLELEFRHYSPETRITDKGFLTLQQFKRLESFTCNCDLKGLNPENIRAAIQQHEYLATLTGTFTAIAKSLKGLKNGQENHVIIDSVNGFDSSDDDGNSDDDDNANANANRLSAEAEALAPLRANISDSDSDSDKDKS